MSLSRRRFIQTAAAVAAVRWPGHAAARQSAEDASASSAFPHGVASGDPDANGVMLWTRVSPEAIPDARRPVEVRWIVAADERLAAVVAAGSTDTAAVQDFTVKVDVGGLDPGRPYFYAFEAAGRRSPIGRTKTLAAGRVARVRLAVVSCSNYPAGFFNVYRCLAERDDLDVVVHLGDYIYEFANGVYGDGAAIGRVPDPPGEAATLEEYRSRYATYRSDPDLQAVHRRHPFIAVWDDHELANDAWAGGSPNHAPEQGSWSARLAAAYRAYLEWLPVREQRPGHVHLYRAFRIGALADLVMLDTRGLRDRQIESRDRLFASPARTLLGHAQETWFGERLLDSERAGTRWRLVGQQVLFAPLTPPGLGAMRPDAWDGYPAARERVFDVLAARGIRDVAFLTGDLHSSWALDVPRNPWGGYNPSTGAGSAAVEFVAPAVSSPGLFTGAAGARQAALLQAATPHLKYLEGGRQGYLVIDVTPARIEAQWHYVSTVLERSARQSPGPKYVCEHGASRIERG